MQTKKDITLVIMAAGIGSRFGGGVKQLQRVGPSGQLIIDYSIWDAIKAGFNKIVFVIRRDIEKDFKEMIGDRVAKKVRVEYCFQEKEDLPDGFVFPEGRTKPWGTGQAVLAARSAVQEPFAVINADDYYGKSAFCSVYNYLSEHYGESENCCMAGFVLKNTLSENGAVTRGVVSVDGVGNLKAVQETKGIVKCSTGAAVQVEDGLIPIDENSVVSMNMWGLQPAVMQGLERGFCEFLSALPQGDVKSEFLLPTFIDGQIKQGVIAVKMLKTEDAWFGVTYAEDKQAVISALKELTQRGEYPEIMD